MRDILLVLFLFVAIFYAFKRPYLGVAAWAWIALTAPANWAFGFSTSFRLNLTIVLVTVLAYIFAGKNKKFSFNIVSFWVLMLVIWTLLSTINTLNIMPSQVWYYWNQFTKVLLLYFFITIVLQKRLHIDTLIWAIVLSISSYAAMEAVKFIISAGGHRIVGRAGAIADRNDLAVAINMCIPLIVYLIQTVKHKWLTIGLWGLLALNILSIIGTYSRGGFIGLAILAIAFWLKSKRKLVWALVAVLMLPVAINQAPEDWKERQNTVATATTSDSSFIGRLWAWKISIMIARDNPLTGGGFKAVTDPVQWHKYAPYTDNYWIFPTPPIPANLQPKAAHNIYLQVLGDHGYAGLFIYLSFLLSCWLVNYKNRKLAKQHQSDWCYKLSNALVLSMVGYGITGANVSLAYFELVFALAGIVSVIAINKLYLNNN